MRPPLRGLSAAALVLAASVLAPALAHGQGPVPSPTAGCRAEARVSVPGVERQQATCLADMTTAALAGTPYTDIADQAGLAAQGTRSPSGVAGMQIDGYFPDTSHTNTEHGWNHDAQFVIRLPDNWNGGLVVTGAPGNRKQYSTDLLISDHVLAAGYAYAATDKGNTGPDFYRDGRRPGDALAEWNSRTTQLTRAARRVVHQYYGKAPRRTFMTGISNGGYLTRWQLENHPELYDGGVDWEGILWSKQGPQPLDSLSTAVAYATGSATPSDMYAAGFARGSEFLWPYHQSAYWGLSQKVYRAEFDPTYDPHCPGASAGSTLEQILAPCPSDAGYDYARRPAAVHRAVAGVALTGAIRRPLITLHGDLDTLLPIATHSAVYDHMVRSAGREGLHRFYTIEGGNHIDGLYDSYPDRLRPVLPCYRSALAALTAWVEDDTAPPSDRTVHRDPGSDLVNTCALR